MKTYVKPDLCYEDFAVSNSVAANCTMTDDRNGNFQNGDICSYNYYGEITLFNNELYGCVTTPEGAGLEEYCTTTGDDDIVTNFFGS